MIHLASGQFGFELGLPCSNLVCIDLLRFRFFVYFSDALELLRQQWVKYMVANTVAEVRGATGGGRSRD